MNTKKKQESLTEIEILSDEQLSEVSGGWEGDEDNGGFREPTHSATRTRCLNWCRPNLDKSKCFEICSQPLPAALTDDQWLLSIQQTYN